jgi:kumamolisin
MKRQGFSNSFGMSGSGQRYTPLAGSEIGPMPHASIVSLPNPCREIEITVVLRRPQGTATESHLAAEELGALLPRERRHLSRRAYAAAQGPDQADLNAVTRFARVHGLRVVGRHIAGRTIHLRGSIANVSAAFRTKLAIYRYFNGHYRGRTGPILVPAHLEGVIQAVFGLDNRPVARTHFRRKHELAGIWAHALGKSYPPPEIAKLYNFPSGADGTGQCIGIIELGGGFIRSDLQKYFAGLGIRVPQVVEVGVNGGRNNPTGNPNGPDGEVMLDIEVAGAVAPGAKIVVYFAPNTNQGFLRAINRAIHDNVNQPTTISISWGGPEASWTAQALQSFDQAFQAAAQIGVTVCASAGDGGSSDGVPGHTAHVDFPASSPFVVACGGTRLESSGGSITSEAIWNDGARGGAGGGGISDFFPLPAWQSGANVPHSVNSGHKGGRGLPDVAANADEQTGYQVRVDGVDTVIGGTSAVAPLMAGLVALLNEKIGTPVGYLNPLIYKTLNSGLFRDITLGNNDMTGLVGGYKAGPGWDAASGLGAPDGNAILAALNK